MSMTENQITEFAIRVGLECEVNTWLELKKILLVSLPPPQRRVFSTRDPKTKKQSINSFEKKLVNNYYSMTGIQLEVPNE